MLVVAATLAAFWPVLGHGFVNWDDPDVLVRNEALERPGVVHWAFTTRHVGHYQPLAWLAWAGVRRAFGPRPEPLHAISLLLHAANAVLLYLLALRLGGRCSEGVAARAVLGAVAALLFALHPLRAEPVAWASAFPFVLALGPLLVSALAYVESVRAPKRPAWRALSVGAYAVSLLCRPATPGFPVALLCLDLVLGRFRAGPGVRALILEKLPYALLAAMAVWVEAAARTFVGLDRIGLLPRLARALAAPFVYAFQSLVPLRLSPLDPLPLEPVVSWAGLLLGGAGLVLVGALFVRLRPRWPWLMAGGLAYVALLAPFLGLNPTGLQASADRYTYFAGAPLALVAARAVAPLLLSPRLRLVGLPLTAAVLVALGAAAGRQVRWWRDSVTLWTRALELDPRNDVALYNLALALAEAGDEEGAAARYQETLRLVPDHAPARRNLALLEAGRLERQANDLAARGRLDAAASLYARALERDPERVHARAARGVVLTGLGRFAEAVPELKTALALGEDDPEVANALALALVQTGRDPEARDVLAAALARRPGDTRFAHNLARLLATSADPRVRDGSQAVRLAEGVREATRGDDPRALDTLAAAYAAAGRTDAAIETSTRAATLARSQGHTELAARIAVNGRRYRTATPPPRK